MSNLDRFKFRVWDKRNKKYWFNNIEFCSEEGFYISYSEKSKGCGCCWEDITIKSKDLVVQQCIGLKDKNGKLICEGDIIKSWEGLIGKVYYHEYGAFYWGKGLNFSEYEDMEVIGNIFENPELLTNKEKYE